jgi:hypothetical protein
MRLKQSAGEWGGGTIFPMNKLNRLALGLASSLLLAAGFSKLAEGLDPVSHSLGVALSGNDDSCAGPCSCTLPCFYEAKSAV